MLYTHTPSQTEQRKFAARELRPYWSGALPHWLRKWGFLFSADPNASGERGFHIYTRGLSPATADHSCFVEGPVSTNLLAEYGIVAETVTAKSILLSKGDIADDASDAERMIATGFYSSFYGYPIDSVRRIPKANREKSEPYTYLDEKLGEPLKPISFQTFTHAGGKWKTLAYVECSGRERSPVIVSNGEITFCGLPIFDLLCEKMAIASLPDGYYAAERLALMPGEEIFVANTLIRLCRETSTPLYRFKTWPQGFEAAVTIRHDYDRPISDYDLDRILRIYEDNGVWSSCGFLARLTPETQARAFYDAGHEVCLHTEKAEEKDIQAEIDTVEAAFGVRPSGVTPHGGAGAVGHLGETLFRVADRLEFQHADILGRFNHIPHCALGLNDGAPELLSLVLMGLHRSLDIGTAPHAHCLSEVITHINAGVGSGAHINIMNHPDIHIPELFEAIKYIPEGVVWNATHGKIAEWTSTVKYGSQIIEGGSSIAIEFSQPIPEDAVVVRASPGRPMEALAPKGATHFDLDTDWRAVDEVNAYLPPYGKVMDPVFQNSAELYREKTRRIRTVTNAYDGPVGAIVRKEAEKIDFWTEMAGAAGLEPAKTAPRFHVFSGGGAGLPTPFGPPATIFSQQTEGLYEKTIICRTVRFFDGPWGRSLLALANNLTRPGGEVVVPIASRKPAPAHLHIEDMRSFFGQSGRKSPCKRYLAFKCEGRMETPESIFSWAVEHSATLFMEEMGSSAGAVTEDPLVDDFLRQSENVDDLMSCLLGDKSDVPDAATGPSIESKLKTYLGSMDYLVTGIGYKAPIIAHIIRNQIGGEREISFLDMGGGFGALAAELLLTPDINVTRGETRDIAPQNLLYGRRLYAAMHEALRQRYYFSLGRSESFNVDQEYDVVSFVGSLLYVPRDDVEIMLERLWSALKPGGLFIVHENIRSSAYARDYKYMFEPEELEGYLRRFGDIRYYSSSSLTELEPSDIERKTVFRAVQKT